MRKTLLKREIAFICEDSTDMQSMVMLAKEAEKRGYKVKLSTNPFEKSEIGIYNGHFPMPFYSKYSIIFLHDMAQSCSQWPNIWKYEPWYKFDIGVLPSIDWTERFLSQLDKPYAIPKEAVYELGFFKADIIQDSDFQKHVDQIAKNIGLDREKKTVLYAPSWENDKKQDDFVKAMLKLENVNVLIKHYPFTPQNYPEIYENMVEMVELHKDIDNVYILDPHTNLFHAIALADVLVSDESSAIVEANLAGIPSVCVTDWLLAASTVIQQRVSIQHTPITIKTTKRELSDTIESVLGNYDEHQQIVKEYIEKTFPHQGNGYQIMLDIIDNVIEGKDLPYPRIEVRKPKWPILLRFKMVAYSFFRMTYNKWYPKRGIYQKTYDRWRNVFASLYAKSK